MFDLGLNACTIEYGGDSLELYFGGDEGIFYAFRQPTGEWCIDLDDPETYFHEHQLQ